MDQLTLSFNEEVSYQLKSTKWNFNSRPGSTEKPKTTNMFVTLDRPEKEKNIIPPSKEKTLKAKY